MWNTVRPELVAGIAQGVLVLLWSVTRQLISYTWNVISLSGINLRVSRTVRAAHMAAIVAELAAG